MVCLRRLVCFAPRAACDRRRVSAPPPPPAQVRPIDLCAQRRGPRPNPQPRVCLKPFRECHEPRVLRLPEVCPARVLRRWVPMRIRRLPLLMALTDMVRPPESNKAARRHVVNSPPGHHCVGKDDNKEVPSDRACLCLTTHPLGLLSEPYSQLTSAWGRVVCLFLLRGRQHQSWIAGPGAISRERPVDGFQSRFATVFFVFPIVCCRAIVAAAVMLAVGPTRVASHGCRRVRLSAPSQCGVYGSLQFEVPR